MISGRDAFHLWAPEGDFWSSWAKPVVFAQSVVMTNDTPLVIPPLDLPDLPRQFDQAAVVVDLRGADAVGVGLALAERGFRPVPMFNGTSGPKPVVPTEDLERALGAGAEILRRMTIAPDARPAFLLDSERSNQLGAGEPGRYDNRWVILPQDLPSARLLRERGINEIVLLRHRAVLPEQDLTHVLLRWQEGGLRLRGITLDNGVGHASLSLSIPSHFRSLWYAVVAAMGLRRSNVGGFGGLVPEQTQHSGFYG